MTGTAPARRRRVRTPTGKTWQQTKSENTRVAILDAAIHCFHEVGYYRTTTEKIAAQAGVSRGAMLHHFPSRSDLIRATVHHLADKRLELFEREEQIVQEDAEHSRIGEGIENYWRQLDNPLFIVFQELVVVARTDAELREILVPVMREFDKRWSTTTEQVFPDLALSRSFIDANMVSKYLLEGLAAEQVLRPSDARNRRVIAWLKEQLHAMFHDVSSVDRRTARERGGHEQRSDE